MGEHTSITGSPVVPADGLTDALDLLQISRHGAVLHLRLNRPAKRNAISDALIAQLHTAFLHLPADVRAVLVSGEGEHFCAGLDLSALVQRDIGGAVLHSRGWHAAFDAVQFGRVPVVVVLHGAVVGGGLELAAACHIRVAEDSAYFGLPEGQRGIFVGGGGSVRIPRLIGVARMTDMMLTGRVYDADEGERYGLVQYRVPAGEGLKKGLELAQKVAEAAPMTAFAVMHALPRIAEQSPAEGLFTESLMSAVAASTPEAQERLGAFLKGKAAKVVKS
ncbi:crotonase/enoyl-CoA hydratase family protein [Roseateles koreensis]|uniref:Crotonase/enoyl-CoA hydratase family protein n=1 Tax=Roseateles koreensis TaxID=2987526 RepID=A0ABT5KLT0_9BURK|nr:crotonase/enoyl-CoA hydratase family protein [Roseateles koreensis]MDC8783819.1 crotonase/enoyl-CoA hydratase family protein [Roseateles koreensis]